VEPGCKLEGFGRPAQPAAPNRPRCRAWWCLDDIGEPFASHGDFWFCWLKRENGFANDLSGFFPA